MRSPAIPTKYNGIQFRSRLEATWAAFFDRLGWKWEYEPFDTNGWIPDFVLLFPMQQRVLVEVKPATSKAELLEPLNKINRSGYDQALYSALVVGASPFAPHPSGCVTLGLGRGASRILRRRYFVRFPDGRIEGEEKTPVIEAPAGGLDFVWTFFYAEGESATAYGFGHSPTKYKTHTICNSVTQWSWPSIPVYSDDTKYLRGYWAEAKNEVQWFPSVRP
jgi:hypothetical protein